MLTTAASAAAVPAAASVLVVDDNPDACRMMAALVGHCGHDAHWATSGEAALAFVSARPVKLVILDVMMPGVDGMEVLRRLRTDPANRAVRVALWSAVEDPAFIAEAGRKGADDYWLKAGFDYSDLPAMLGRVLEEGGGSGRERRR